MILIPIGNKKIVNLDSIISINITKEAYIFNSITGTYVIASKKDFDEDELKFRKWKHKLNQYLTSKYAK